MIGLIFLFGLDFESEGYGLVLGVRFSFRDRV